SLDYEKEKAVNVTVTAKDAKGASVSKTVKINVQDVNEQPDLTVGKNEVSIKENVQGATITTVQATDEDGDKISYSVSDSRFEVVSGNLKLKAGQSLDYENEKTVSVTVTAKDAKGASVSKTVKINVSNDTADDPVTPTANQAPVWSKASETVSVKENKSGETISTKETARDPDGDTLTYSIDSASQKLFTIDSKTGILKVKDALDYETAQSHTVKVTASDGKLSAVKTVTVNVEDVNEQPELSVGKSEVSLKENQKGATITTVSFKDPDGDSPVYEVSDERFEVVSGNLKLKDGQALDFEKEKVVNLTVTAKDGKGLEDVETVKINVQNDTADDPLPELKFSYDADAKTMTFANLQKGAFEVSLDGGKTWENYDSQWFPSEQIANNSDGTIDVTTNLFAQSLPEGQEFDVQIKQGDNVSKIENLQYDVETHLRILHTEYKDGSVRISGLGEKGANVVIKIGDEELPAITVSDNRFFTISKEVERTDSTQQLDITLTTTDASNNTNTVSQSIEIPALIPVAPTIIANDGGSVSITLPEDNDKVVITFMDENGRDHTVTLNKDTNGKLQGEDSYTQNPLTINITKNSDGADILYIPAQMLKDNYQFGPVKATGYLDNAASATVSAIPKVDAKATAAEIIVNNGGSAEIKLPDDVDSVVITFKDEQQNKHTVTCTHQDDSWQMVDDYLENPLNASALVYSYGNGWSVKIPAQMLYDYSTNIDITAISYADDKDETKLQANAKLDAKATEATVTSFYNGSVAVLLPDDDDAVAIQFLPENGTLMHQAVFVQKHGVWSFDNEYE
ncbi:MAG: cadherin repeat domain-containing protein, partial [Neisseriaceae bacterium]|nr:cadherin repeat domain-containing protein [Neisseriaceae bacterium]